MEIPLILSAVAGLGYVLNKNGKVPRMDSVDTSGRYDSPGNEYPIKNNNRSYEIERNTLQDLTNRNHASFEPYNSSIVPYTPYHIGGKASKPMSQGHRLTGKDTGLTSDPTQSAKIRSEKVTGGLEHNNMQPYFGSNITQNTDAMNGQSGRLLETYTGTGVGGTVGGWSQKRETPQFFKPVDGLSHVWGAPVAERQPQLERYNETLTGIQGKMNNVTPIETIKVGPGLNVGADITATGGFHQQVRFMPQNVDEYKLNQYEARVHSTGSSYVQKPEQMGIQQNNAPPGDYYYEDHPPMPTSGGERFHKPLVREQYSNFNNGGNCTDPELTPYSGHAAPVNAHGQMDREAYKSDLLRPTDKELCYTDDSCESQYFNTL
jgi:hypothetical protein